MASGPSTGLGRNIQLAMLSSFAGALHNALSGQTEAMTGSMCIQTWMIVDQRESDNDTIRHKMVGSIDHFNF